MRKESLIFLVAIISGVVAFILISQFLRAATTVVPKVQFVVAQNELKEGKKVEQVDLALSEPMDKKENEDKIGTYFMQIPDVVGKVPVKDISPSTIILREDMKEEETAPVVEAPPKAEALVIPQGMKALTLSEEAINSLPMGLEKGQSVDVIGFGSPYEGSTDKELETLVRAARVIATQSSEGKVRSVTLALTSEAILVLSRAMTDGKLSLVARSADSQDNEQSVVVLRRVTEIIRGVEREKKSVSTVTNHE